jgi:ATP-dependent helicase HrpB
VVVATNVAETSLTIAGVRLVVDSGLARVPRFDPYRGINTLLTEKISRASADQRAGRAGRTAAGHCLRLWTEAQHKERAPRTEPEIRRLDLAEVVLTLKACADLSSFPWLDLPEEKALERACRLLTDLGALDIATGAITPLGLKLVSFPAHPRLARMLLAAGEWRCVRTAALIAALQQERNLLLRRQGDVVNENRDLKLETEPESDFFRLIRAWQYAREHNYDTDACRGLGIHALTARRVEQVCGQFLDLARDHGLEPSADAGDAESIQRCILTGFADQLARRADPGSFRCALIHGRTGLLAKESVVRRSELLVASEIREVEAGRKDVQVLLSLCTAVKREWLHDCWPDAFSEKRTVALDPAAQRVLARVNLYFRDLLLESRMGGAPDPEEASMILADEVMAGRTTLKHWSNEAEQWVQRVNLVAESCPDLGISAIGDAQKREIVARICHGALSVKEIKDRPVLPALKAWLPGAQRATVEKLAPERLTLPNGRTPKVVYGAKAQPHIALRIQELYGVQSRLSIAGGRVAVVIHILAPNQRPVQITEDLANFWREAYPKVKKELQRKYPKHEWR